MPSQKIQKIFSVVRQALVTLLIAATGSTWQLVYAADTARSGYLNSPFLTIETAVMVKDIYLGSGSSIASGNLENIDGTVYFYGSDGINGGELWKSDGTPEGTSIVKDILPGASGSSVMNLENINGTLYFTAMDGIHGVELWKSDGTTAGTEIVKDINPGSSGSFPNYLTNVNGTLFFVANDGTHGTELWMSDSTPEGTVLVADINTGVGSPNLSKLADINGMLYFSAYESTHGQELWKSDGTPEGTTIVKDIFPGIAGSYPGELTNVNGIAYFVAAGDLNGYNDYELWKSDGTSDGTILVKDIWPGINTSSPNYLQDVNGTLFFFATDGTHGSELWKSDGTPGGTTMVKDVWAGASGGGGTFTHIGNMVYFGENDGINGWELWKSDGTSAGTSMIKDIVTGSGSSGPQDFININNLIYFVANNGLNGSELWKSDGTGSGTIMVKDINPSGDSWPGRFVNANGFLFFTANDGEHGYELWKTETVNLPNIVTNNNDAGPGSLRQAIADSVNGDTIQFDLSLSGQTISLASTLIIDKNIKIDGSGLEPHVKVSGDYNVRVFSIGSSVTVSINHIDIINGNSADHGGGIDNWGNLTISNCNITNNNAQFAGGGIENQNPLGSLTVINSTFSNNSALEGGGIDNFYGILTISTSNFFGNTATSLGGAIKNDGTLAISNSGFSNNNAENGGGIVNSGEATISSSTLFQNSASFSGGGILNASNLSIVNATFYNNSAVDCGGGLCNTFGTVTAINSTFADNIGGGIYNQASGTLHLINNILANSINSIDCYNEGVISTNTNNLIETNGWGINTCGTPTITNDPQLGILTDNGGSTQTMILLPGSPATDAGNDAYCPETDERGIARIQGPRCDIGAVEVQYHVVTNTNDSGIGSLRQAISDTLNGDIIQFNPTLAGQIITLATSLRIEKSITIDSSGLEPHIQVSGNNTIRVLYVDNVNTALINLDISNGNAENDPGGGIENTGTLTVANTNFYGNRSGTGGGAIENIGTLILKNNKFYNNNTIAVGGCIHNVGALTIIASTFVNNFSEESGGCIVNQMNQGTLKIDGSTFSKNSAAFGGAILNGNSLTISNSTFYENEATVDGGGILNAATATIQNSTFSMNSALENGGGIQNGFTDENFIGTLKMINTIIANSKNGGDCVNENGNIDISIHNLIEDGSCFASITGSPKLGSIGDYGGTTQTMSLLPGSSAIDAGDDTNCPTTDQRGVARPIDGDDDGTATCDIGAYEASSNPYIDFVSRVNASPLSAASVDFTVTFSEPVTGVDISDFSLVVTNISEASIINVLDIGDQSSYTVTVSTGIGNGTIRLDVNASGTGIQDAFGNALEGGYITGEVYEIINHAPPTDIFISNGNIDENLPANSEIGDLSTTDPDVGDTFTYSFCGGDDDASFQINGFTLESTEVFDYETKSSYSICVRSKDSTNLSTTELFTININNIDENAPSLLNYTGSTTNYQPPAYVSRYRFVNTNLSLLVDPSGQVQLAVSESITLKLFDDTFFVTTVQQVHQESTNVHSWVGSIDGTEIGHVIMTVSDGIFTAQVNTGSQMYQVNFLENDLYVVTRIDPSAFPEDNPPQPPPSQPTK